MGGDCGIYGSAMGNGRPDPRVPQRDYNTKFGISLAKRNAEPIEPARNLIAESSFTEVEVNSEALDHLQKDFDIQPGDVDMLMLDQVIQDEYQLPQTVMVASTQTRGANFHESERRPG